MTKARPRKLNVTALGLMTGLGITLAVPGAQAAQPARNLNWPGKSVQSVVLSEKTEAPNAPPSALQRPPKPHPSPLDATDPTPQAPVRYTVPPSPYGQVGNFYKGDLTWPGKPGSVKPSAPNAQVLASNAPSKRPTPIDIYTTKPKTYQPIPQREGRAQSSAPLASMTTPPALPVPEPKRPLPVSIPAKAPEAPAPAPLPKPQATAPTYQPSYDTDEAVPVSALSVAQPGVVLKPVNAPKSAKMPASPEVPRPSVTPPVVPSSVVPPKAEPKPAPAQPVASTATTTSASDYQLPKTSKYYRAPEGQSAPGKPQAVIPGETITDPSTQSPRYYSLHRDYGLKPDTITLSPEDLPVAQVTPAPAKDTQNTAPK